MHSVKAGKTISRIVNHQTTFIRIFYFNRSILHGEFHRAIHHHEGRTAMDFQNINPLNILLNKISGNLLPMIADDSSFPIFWRIYSVLIWLLEVVQLSVLIIGCILVPKEKALKDGSVAIVVTIEVMFMVTRIYTRKGLMKRFIQKMNEILRLEDEMMRIIVTATLKSMEIPLKFYWSAGLVSIIVWSGTPFVLILERDVFFYVDYRMPVSFTKEPFSTAVFVLGSVIVLISSVYIFTKKVSVDTYMIHLILLVTAQYRYIASKLPTIFENKSARNDHNDSDRKEYYSRTDQYLEKQIKTICRHHNAVLQ